MIKDDKNKTGQEKILDRQEEQNELEKSLAEWEDKYKRALADYQNLAKRSEEERIRLLNSAGARIIEKLLPVLDSLDLSYQHLKDEGLRLSIQKFEEILQNEGVKEIETKDKEFDPHLMEAVETAEGETGKVVSEIRKGYLLNGKLLRPAQVIVGRRE